MGLLAIALLNSRNRWTDAEIERLTESRARYHNLHPAGTLIEGMLQMLMAWKVSNTMIIERLEEQMAKQEQEAV